MLTNKKAVSTFMLLILMSCSAVFGALTSYLWVMANFYFEPENTVDLVITDVDFPVDHADYFYVTVMNPTHSSSNTSITEIYFTVAENTTYHSVTNTYPEELPIPLQRGTSKTIKCSANWGDFAGKTITVHVSAINASGAVCSVTTDFVRLELQTYFNATESIKHFNVTVKNDERSRINLTLTKVYFYSEVIGNMSIELPKVIHTNETIQFQCFYDWTGRGTPLVQVETLEGYIYKITKEVPSAVLLQVTDVKFNETNPNEVGITLSNSANSETLVDVTDIVLAYNNETDHINVSRPTLPYRLEINDTVTFNCEWNWTDKSYRDINVTVTAYTKQGFVSYPREFDRTPSEVVAKITDVKFDLDDTEHLLVNVTNMQCSLYDINVTKIEVNQESATMNSSIIAKGEQVPFTCEFNWTKFVGQNVNITAAITYNENMTATSHFLWMPYIKIREDVRFSNFTLGNPYVNITMYHSAFSTTTANITQILIETENGTYSIDGTITNPKISPQGYALAIGTEITIVCPWDWNPYLGKDVTVTVQTADGRQVSRTVQVAYSPP